MDGEGTTVIRSDDAPPLVCLLGASLGRAAAQPKVARDLRRARGRVARRSTTGPQAATIDFAGGVVRVVHGVADDVDVLIEADLDTMGRLGADRTCRGTRPSSTSPVGVGSASGWASLTPTELSVVRLVAEGLSNQQVAERLFVAPRTVGTHLTHVYAKLGISSRTELAVAALRRR
jgi:DNA-binding CsgD family transcriptional regulator